MPKSTLITAIREPGLSRKLTLAFMAVIAVVMLTLPITVLSFQRISSASDRAGASTRTLQNAAKFQQAIGDVRASARDYAADGRESNKDATIRSMRTALEIARCMGGGSCPDGFEGGERLPDDEARQWNAIADAAANANTDFQKSITNAPSRKIMITGLDRNLAIQVNDPAQVLTEKASKRGTDAQGDIKEAIYGSMSLLVMVLLGALLVASVLATVIPRKLMGRLTHLRQVAHRLAHGDLTARADEKVAQRNDEIGDLIVDFNLMAIALQARQAENMTLQEQLQITLQQEQERATRDPLTGLRNHRYFQESLRAEIERCRRTGGVVSIAMLDLDDFKQVNDRFGHSEGDAVLLRATKGISDNLRPYDLACRLGGEEFGIIFPEAAADEAKMVMDRIAEHILPFGPNGERLSFSGGITTYPLHASAQAELTQRADEASYSAKMAGKASTQIYDPAKVTAMNSEDRIKQRSRDAMLTTATTLVSAVDQKDPYTRNHSELVAIYTATIARAMRLDEATVKLVYRAGLLHDVGKIGIADEILVKGSALTHDEWVQLRMHPEFSYRILEAAEMEPVATWTRYHHEHFDGTGYPVGLQGADIPLGSRIILVADAFESMTSDRIYRRALGMRQALDELRAGAGRQFDPQVVETMVSLVEAGVFTQVMQQYGRVIEPAQVDEHGGVIELDPATSSAAAAAAALDGVPPPPAPPEWSDPPVDDQQAA